MTSRRTYYPTGQPGLVAYRVPTTTPGLVFLMVRARRGHRRRSHLGANPDPTEALDAVIRRLRAYWIPEADTRIDCTYWQCAYVYLRRQA